MGDDKSHGNFWLVLMFVMGVFVGVFITMGMQRPPIPATQLLYNDCPRVEGGSMWCPGPGAPPP